MGRLRLRRVAAPSPPHEEPELFNFVRDVVEPLAAGPRRNALTFVGRDGVIEHWSYADVAGDAARWAALLRERGLQPDDSVLVLVGRSPAWPAVVLGALKAGFVAAPCPETIAARDLELWAAHCGARLTVADRAHVPALAAVGVEPDIVVEDVADELRHFSGTQPSHDTAAADLALLLFGSATDRELKAVMHTHAYTQAVRTHAERWLDARPEDRIWCTAAAGSAESIRDCLFGPWSVGAETVIHDGDFEPDERLELVGRLGVTVLCQTPGEYRLLAGAASVSDADLQHLRRAVVEGAVRDSHIVQESREALGVTVTESVGRAPKTLEEHMETIRIALDVAADGSPPKPVDEEDARRRQGLQGAAAAAKVREYERRRREQEIAAAAAAAARAAEDERLRQKQERAAAAMAEEDERRRHEQEAAAAAAAAARAAEDERLRQKQERAAAAKAKEDERRRREQEIAAAAAAAARAAEDERLRQKQERAAAAKAKEDERLRLEHERAEAARAQEEERLRQEQELAAAAAAKAAEDERRRQEQERAAVAAQAADAERRRKEQEKAAAARAKDDERERKQQEKAAAAEARRAAEAGRAAEREAARLAEQQRRAAEAARRRARGRRASTSILSATATGHRSPGSKRRARRSSSNG